MSPPHCAWIAFAHHHSPHITQDEDSTQEEDQEQEPEEPQEGAVPEEFMFAAEAVDIGDNMLKVQLCVCMFPFLAGVSVSPLCVRADPIIVLI